MSQIERASEIAHTLQTPGMAHIWALLEAQRQDALEALEHIMDAKPEQLTGKTAVKLAARRKALANFRESVEDEVKILVPPNRKAGDEVTGGHNGPNQGE